MVPANTLIVFTGDLGGESYRTDVFRNECDVQLESMNNTVPLFSTDVSSARKSNKRTVKGCERNSDSNVYSSSSAVVNDIQ